MYPPPTKIGKVEPSYSDFWCIPPPPQEMEKLKSQVNVTFRFSGQSDILVLADVPPPPGMEKLKSQVNVTFWFSGQSDILVLADVPPPPPQNGNWTKHECYRKKSFQERSSSTFYNLPLPLFQYHYLILCLNRKLVNFISKWIWIYGLEPHPPPLSSQKMKCSFLDYVQLLMIVQAGQWTRTPSATPLQSKKLNAHFWITFNF